MSDDPGGTLDSASATAQPGGRQASLRGATLRLSAQISVATALGLVISLVARLITAKLLGPVSYGLLRTADVLQQYAGYADLGAKFSVSRQISILLGRGRTDEAHDTASVLFTWTVLVAAGVTLLLWALLASGTTVQGLLTLPNVVILTFILLANRANTFLANYVRGYGEFDAVGTQFFITALLPPLALVPAVYLLGVTGGLLSQLLVAVAVGLNLVRYARRRQLFRLRWLLDWRRTRELLETSVLLQANAMSETLFESLELTLLIIFLPMDQVGLYGFAIGWMASTLSGLAGARLVVERAMLLEPAHAEGPPLYAQYRRYMRAPLVVNILVAAVSLGAMYFAFDWVVARFLPAFEPAMTVAQVLVFGQLVYASTSFPRLYFNATDQLRNRLLFALFGLGLNVVLDLAFLAAGYGILGVAVGSTISYCVYAAVLMPVCTRQIEGSAGPGLSFVVRLLASASMSVAALVVLSEWTPLGTSVPPATAFDWATGAFMVAIKIGLYATVVGAIYVLAFWGYRADLEVRTLFRLAWSSVRRTGAR